MIDRRQQAQIGKVKRLTQSSGCQRGKIGPIRQRLVSQVQHRFCRANRADAAIGTDSRDPARAVLRELDQRGYCHAVSLALFTRRGRAQGLAL